MSAVDDIVCVERDSPAWDRAWSALSDLVRHESNPCPTCGEDWQYECSTRGGTLHHFRHRCYPIHGSVHTNHRVYLKVEA